MEHITPWYTCDQCGRFILPTEKLENQELHFCEGESHHCKEIYEQRQAVQAIP